MKKSLAIGLVLIFVLSISMVAFADSKDPDVTITSDSGVYTVEQGDTLDLTATSVMASNTHNWRLTSQSWTGATMVAGGNVVDDELNATTPPSGTLQFVSYAEFSAVGKQPGLYDVDYSITVLRLQGSQVGEGADEIEIEVTLEGTIAVYVEPMAAPAVAAQILKFNEVQPRYGNPRNGGNFIADVAHEMEPQTLFNDVPKEVWCDAAGNYVSNPCYWAEVLAFLNDHSEMKVELDCAYDWFVETLE